MTRPQGGFTLVELMIVVLLIGITLGIAVPFYRDYIATSERAVMAQKIDSFRIFEENYRIDNDAYLPGDYAPGGVNDFAVLGYAPPNDDDGIGFRVLACDGGAIENCFRVEATNREGMRLVWDNGAFLE